VYCINAYLVDCLTTCPALNPPNGTLEEGEEHIMEMAGCCPHWRKVCRQERCAPPPACPAHLVRTVNTSTLHNCCTKYTCGKVKLYCTVEEWNINLSLQVLYSFLVMVYSALFNNVFEASITEQTMLPLPFPPANVNKMTIIVVF
jgi:hypothetical protein